MNDPIDPAIVEKACEAYRHPKRMLTNDSVTRHHDCMTAALEAALPLLEQQIREQIEGELRREAQHARDAYRAAETDHFAHDYCRWVGHAEALSSAAERIARTRKET